jgi:meiotically up-regulated gene 157 (Mug157) protein
MLILFLLALVCSNRIWVKKFEHFRSKAIDDYITEIKPKFQNKQLADIFHNCFINTLETTIEATEDDTFVITGDIEAMWLRDSVFQTLPYIQFANKDEKIKKMFLNLIKRHTKSILIDPYANAFNKDEFISPWQTDETYKIVNGKRIHAMNPKIWERKYELDSIISTLYLADRYYKMTNDSSFVNSEWIKGIYTILNVAEQQSLSTDEEDEKGGPQYFFQRSAKESFDSLHHGRGNPTGSCGLIKSAFRGSDDATLFQYNIPENAFASATFLKLSELILKHDESLSKKLAELGKNLRENIFKHGVFEENGKKYFAYEIDCYGNHYFMDDPNYPSLTSLPFFGFIDKDNEIYKYTRSKILSKANPYYFKGKIGDGLGSPHSQRQYIWPLFTIMRVLTTDDKNEIINGINLLLETAKSTGFMHESVNVNNVEEFTRPWFAWANSFFGYMINNIIERHPELILKK